MDRLAAQLAAQLGPGQQLAHEPLMQRVPAALHLDVGLEAHAQQGQVAEQVEHLVAHELVRPAQPLAVEHAALVQHDGVVEAAAPPEPGAPQRLDLVQEAERTRAAHLALEDAAGDHQSLDGLLADGGMRVVDAVGDLEGARRLDANRAFAIPDLEAATDLEPPARHRLLDDPGGPDQEHERGRAAVHDRDLGSVDLDPRVVDAEAVERRQKMLDCADRHIAAAQGRGIAVATQRIRSHRDLDRMREVAAQEDQPGVGLGGMERQVHGRTRVKPDAGTRDRLRDGSLLQGTPPFLQDPGGSRTQMS